jgi:2-oxoglutarate ferredoxin oxidoreductase subunit alpha
MCSEVMPGAGGVFIQMEDEIASIAAVIGASLGGMKSFTATSGPGMSLMQENLGFAIIAEAPCVIIDVQRFGPSTGVATKTSQGDIMQARWGTHGDHTIIALTPATVQECYDMMIDAFNLAERFSSPVLFLLDASLGHLREKIVLREGEQLEAFPRTKPGVSPEDYLPYRANEKKVPHLSAYGDKHILRVTSLIHDEQGYSTGNAGISRDLVERLESKITDYQDELPSAKYYGPDQTEIVVISYGTSARAARASAAFLNSTYNLGVGMLDLKTMWPFPEKVIKEKCAQASTVFVVEMNKGQVVWEVDRHLKKAEVIPVLRYDTNPMTPMDITDKIREVLK